MAKAKKAGIVVKHYREVQPDDIETLIKLAVKAQDRLAKQGVQLSWHMSWTPVAAPKVVR